MRELSKVLKSDGYGCVCRLRVFEEGYVEVEGLRRRGSLGCCGRHGRLPLADPGGAAFTSGRKEAMQLLSHEARELLLRNSAAQRDGKNRQTMLVEQR